MHIQFYVIKFYRIFIFRSKFLLPAACRNTQIRSQNLLNNFTGPLDHLLHTRKKFSATKAYKIRQSAQVVI